MEKVRARQNERDGECGDREMSGRMSEINKLISFVHTTCSVIFVNNRFCSVFISTE